MKNCKNCNKLFEVKEETFHGLCWPCYESYLYDKIEHWGEKQFESENFLETPDENRFITFFKNLFHK